MDGHTIEEVTHHKHLGLIISKNMYMSLQIDNIHCVCITRLNLMRKLKYKLDRKSLAAIYFSFAHPVIEYGDVLISNLNKLDKSPI